MTEQTPKVFIVLVNWNGRDDTLACLESIRNIEYPNFQVIVVDNGSIDGSVNVIPEAFPEVAVLEQRGNLGFAGGNNLGIRYAMERDAEYIFLLNNDTVVEPNILNKFLEASTRIAQDGIFGAKIYYFSEPNKIWYAGAIWNSEICHFTHIGQGHIDDGKEFNRLSETDYACGCALFVSAKLLRKIGLLDENYFLTYEETDLCYRAKKLGYKSFFVPEAKVWHKISTSFGGAGSPLFSYFLMRNRLLWAKKNLPFSQRMMLYRRICNELLYYILPPSPKIHMLRDKLSRKSFCSSFREYGSDYVRRYNEKNHDPIKKAKLWAVRDFILDRFGDCPATVRSLGK